MKFLYHKFVEKPRTCQEYIKYKTNYNSTKRQSTIILKHNLSEYQS